MRGKAMDYIVYVPQGKSARFDNTTRSIGISSIINGLYTDSISTCCIVFYRNSNTNRMVLSHFDGQTLPEKIAREFEWVNNGSDPVDKLIVRARHDSPILKPIMEYCNFLTPGNVTVQTISSGGDGFLVLQQPNNTIQATECTIGERPENLIHHPQEQRLVAVQKIEQIIGVRARSKMVFFEKSFTIFDGDTWQPLTENDLKINAADKMKNEETRREWELLIRNKDELFSGIASYLMSIADYFEQQGVQTFGSIKDMAISVAQYVEDYFEFDPLSRLQKNLLDFLENTPECKNQEDVQFKSAAIELCKKLNKSSMPELAGLFVRYKKSTAQDKNDFRKAVFAEFPAYIKHYRERQDYAALKEKNKADTQSANLELRAANEALAQQDPSRASDLFLKAINIFRLCCVSDFPAFVSAKKQYEIILGQGVEAAPGARCSVQGGSALGGAPGLENARSDQQSQQRRQGQEQRIVSQNSITQEAAGEVKPVFTPLRDTQQGSQVQQDQPQLTTVVVAQGVVATRTI